MVLLAVFNTKWSSYGTDTVGYITPTVFVIGKPFFHIDWMVNHTHMIDFIAEGSWFIFHQIDAVCQAHIARGREEVNE